MGDKDGDFRNALNMTNLESLEARRTKLCVKFAKKAEQNKSISTGLNLKLIPDLKYWKQVARTSRLMYKLPHKYSDPHIQEVNMLKIRLYLFESEL